MNDVLTAENYPLFIPRTKIKTVSGKNKELFCLSIKIPATTIIDTPIFIQAIIDTSSPFSAIFDDTVQPSFKPHLMKNTTIKYTDIMSCYRNNPKTKTAEDIKIIHRYAMILPDDKKNVVQKNLTDSSNSENKDDIAAPKHDNSTRDNDAQEKLEKSQKEDMQNDTDTADAVLISEIQDTNDPNILPTDTPYNLLIIIPESQTTSTHVHIIASSYDNQDMLPSLGSSFFTNFMLLFTRNTLLITPLTPEDIITRKKIAQTMQDSYDTSKIIINIHSITHFLTPYTHLHPAIPLTSMYLHVNFFCNFKQDTLLATACMIDTSDNEYDIKLEKEVFLLLLDRFNKINTSLEAAESYCSSTNHDIQCCVMLYKKNKNTAYELFIEPILAQESLLNSTIQLCNVSCNTAPYSTIGLSSFIFTSQAKTTLYYPSDQAIPGTLEIPRHCLAKDNQLLSLEI